MPGVTEDERLQEMIEIVKNKADNNEKFIADSILNGLEGMGICKEERIFEVDNLNSVKNSKTCNGSIENKKST